MEGNFWGVREIPYTSPASPWKPPSFRLFFILKFTQSGQKTILDTFFPAGCWKTPGKVQVQLTYDALIEQIHSFSSTNPISSYIFVSTHLPSQALSPFHHRGC